MSTTSNSDLSTLHNAFENGALAIRRTQRLQPAGGLGDKVFPPTYEGGEYALEERVIDGRRVPCVLLDSVQSQANRMESALKAAFYQGKNDLAGIPVVVVDFGAAGLAEVGEITSLDAPHRLADAILRDSMLNGKPFRVSEPGQTLDTASLANATGMYKFCPTALIFGLWDSTGPRGGIGTKFQRAIVAEIAGIDIKHGVRPSSRIDPLGIEKNPCTIYKAKNAQDLWTLDLANAAQDKNKPVIIGKSSEINHGNVTPALKNDKGKLHHGGITMGYAHQSVVLSLPALRRLHFPDSEGVIDARRDNLARVALAALALAGAQLTISAGCDLRSRCLLVPDISYVADWEVLDASGQPKRLSISDPAALVTRAAEAAVAEGLPKWNCLPIVLQPKPDLVQLVERSRALKAAEPLQA
jgi:CRISPR-associated protein Csb1